MDIFMSIIVCFLAVYGVFQIIYNFALYLTQYNNIKPIFSHYVIAIDEKSEDIEAYVRSVALAAEKDEELIIIDASSKPETEHLLYLLQGEYDFVHIMNIDDYKSYIENSLKMNKEIN